MSSHCLQYKNKFILFHTGCGNPGNYEFVVYNKQEHRANRRFTFDNIEDREKILEKVKVYIDTYFNDIMECGDDCPGLGTCGRGIDGNSRM